MSRQQQNRLSLGARFLLWQLAVLMPLLAAALFHHLYQMPHMTEQMEDIVEEVTEEVLQVKSLQLSLLIAAMPVNDYLIHGKQRVRAEFDQQRQRVEQGFSATFAAPFGEEEERQLVASAWHEWEQAKELADELLAASEPVGDPVLSEKMVRFDRHIYAASARLEELYNTAHSEIMASQATTHAAHVESQAMSLIALLLALVLSLLLGSALAQSILLGLRSLHQGASEVAAGHLEKPIKMRGIRELEDLADVFNSMSERLLVHETALQDEAIHDALTGLENRRALNVRLEEELQRAKRYGRSLNLLMLDIDHFKSVNDSYGHPAGDAVLHKLAEIINATVRPVDRVFRYGGEEFVILVPEVSSDGARAAAERLRKTVATTPFPIASDKEITITISIGAARYSQMLNTHDALVAAADNALYQAKQSGRNRVCLALQDH